MKFLNNSKHKTVVIAVAKLFAELTCIVLIPVALCIVLRIFGYNPDSTERMIIELFLYAYLFTRYVIRNKEKLSELSGLVSTAFSNSKIKTFIVGTKPVFAIKKMNEFVKNNKYKIINYLLLVLFAIERALILILLLLSKLPGTQYFETPVKCFFWTLFTVLLGYSGRMLQYDIKDGTIASVIENVKYRISKIVDFVKTVGNLINRGAITVLSLFFILYCNTIKKKGFMTQLLKKLGKSFLLVAFNAFGVLTAIETKNIIRFFFETDVTLMTNILIIGSIASLYATFTIVLIKLWRKEAKDEAEIKKLLG